MLTQIKIFVSIVALSLGAISCQMPSFSPEVPAVDAAEFSELFERTFKTPESNVDAVIRDQRVRVSSESLDGLWYYTQLNTGPDAKLYRQRLLHLKLSDDGNNIIQIAYEFKAPENYVDAWNTPELLGMITREDFDAYFTQGCEQVWTPKTDGSWSGYVDPKSCVIMSKRRNKELRIESEAYLSKNVYRTNERGYEMDMTFLWGTQPGEYIDLYPVE